MVLAPYVAENDPTWVTWMSQGCATSCPTGGCCWTTSPSGWARGRRSRWSAPTAPGKTTLLRIITGDLVPHAGAVTRSGGLGVMRQMVARGSTSVAELLLSVSPPRVRAAAAEVERLELALMEADDEATQLRYASALAEFADAGGYEIEVVWDSCCTTALGTGFDRAKYRDLDTLSGGEQKRLVLEYLLAGPDQVLLLDEPDNFLDVPGKIWLEGRIRESSKTILFISHDRELLNNTATRVVTVELARGGRLRATPCGPIPGASRRTTRRAATGSRASRS